MNAEDIAKMATPMTDARLRELVIKWGRGEYADAHIIEDFTDYARRTEQDRAALMVALRQFTQLRSDSKWFVADFTDACCRADETIAAMSEREGK